MLGMSNVKSASNALAAVQKKLKTISESNEGGEGKAMTPTPSSARKTAGKKRANDHENEETPKPKKRGRKAADETPKASAAKKENGEATPGSEAIKSDSDEAVKNEVDGDEDSA
jgi:hypothetical protein